MWRKAQRFVYSKNRKNRPNINSNKHNSIIKENVYKTCKIQRIINYTYQLTNNYYLYIIIYYII